MEIIRGNHASFIDGMALAERVVGYDSVHLDIGTGDGKFVRHMAHAQPNTFVIGIDACRENLREVSRCAPENALLVIANAQRLPSELCGLAEKITVNFPWGSLLEGLLTDDPGLMAGLKAVATAHVELEVRLNGGALAEAGWSLEEGAAQVRRVLADNGFRLALSVVLAARDLKVYPTTWAKRLAYGRDPRAMCLHGTLKMVEEYAGEGVVSVP